MKKLLFVVLIELKHLLSVAVEVDRSLWQSSDECPWSLRIHVFMGSKSLILRRDEDTCEGFKKQYRLACGVFSGSVIIAFTDFLGEFEFCCVAYPNATGPASWVWQGHCLPKHKNLAVYLDIRAWLNIASAIKNIVLEYKKPTTMARTNWRGRYQLGNWSRQSLLLKRS